MLQRCLSRSLPQARTLCGRSLSTAPEISKFVGAQGAYTEDLKYFYPHKDALPPTMPVYRLIDDDGKLLPGAKLPTVCEDRETCVEMLKVCLPFRNQPAISPSQSRVAFGSKPTAPHDEPTCLRPAKSHGPSPDCIANSHFTILLHTLACLS